MKVDEQRFKFNYKAGARIHTVRALAGMSLPTLHRLYLRYFKKDVSWCSDVPVLVRKLQYLYQRRWLKAHGQRMSPSLAIQTRAVLSAPLPKENTVKKSKTEKPVKDETKGKKSAAVDDDDEDELEDEEEEEETDTDDDDTEDEEEEEEEDPGDDDEDEDEDEDDEEDEDDDSEEEEEPAPAKRSAPARTGEPVTIKLKGEKLGPFKFIYECITHILATNGKRKATDPEIALAIRKGWPSASFEDYRVNADRKKFNAGKFQNQKGAPEKKSVEYSEDGSVRKREIPDQLKKFVKPGQPVAKTIAENKKKIKGYGDGTKKKVKKD